MQSRRFIMLGLDGFNPEFVERFLPELPNFRRLIKEGSWGPMLSTVPVDTPTNWTALATGATAARSRITGFEFHIPNTSLTNVLWPSNSYAKLRAAEFLWEAADRQGKTSLLINYPFAWYSRELHHGVIVGGDQILGGNAQILDSACFCTPDRLNEVPEAQRIILQREDNTYVGQLMLRDQFKRIWSATGPVVTDEVKDKKTQACFRVRTVAGSPPRLLIETDNDEQVAALTPGEWSPYVCFKLSEEEVWLRFLLVDLSADGRSLQLYHTAVTRSDGWTKPKDYASMLLREVGPYQEGLEAEGMVEMKNWFGKLGMEADIELLMTSGNTLVGYAETLTGKIPNWDHLYIQLHNTDGLNHRRLGHMGLSHPKITPELTNLTTKWMLENYRATDAILGKVAKIAENSEAVLVVVSDHSGLPAHTWVDTARPFQEKGWLGFDTDGRWDPSRSRIREMENHSIYINLKGRQPDGIVEPKDYEKVRDEIISTLVNLRDPRTGECPVAIAARREDLASIGTDGACFGDVVYFMRPGYTNQPASEERILTPKILGRFLNNPEDALAKGWALHRSTIYAKHHDYLPNAHWEDLCSLRAILLFHGSGIRKGYRIRGAHVIDVAPTLAEISQISPPSQSEGNVLTDIFE